MFAHTFRGCSWKTWLGIEDERHAFRRYRDIRRGEREYVPLPRTASQQREQIA
jgi:hypothetical protein